MTIIFFLALILYVVVCGVLVSLILMQEGKGGGLSGVMGASMGETFGFGGASKQVRRYTAYCATIFLVFSIVLTFLAEAAFRGAASDFLGPSTAAPATQTVPGTAPVTEEGAPVVEGEAPDLVPPGANAVSPGVITTEQPATEAPAAPAPEAPAAEAPAAPAPEAPAAPAE